MLVDISNDARCARLVFDNGGLSKLRLQLRRQHPGKDVMGTDSSKNCPHASATQPITEPRLHCIESICRLLIGFEYLFGMVLYRIPMNTNDICSPTDHA